MSWVELPAPSWSAAAVLTALHDEPRPFALEGSAGIEGDGLGRTSYVGASPVEQLTIERRDAHAAWRRFADWLAECRADAPTVGEPAIVGFATYEAGRLAMAPPLPLPSDTLGLPLFDWGYYGALFRRDEVTGACAVLGRSQAEAEALLARLVTRLPTTRPPPPLGPRPFTAEWSDDEYRELVVKIVDYLRAGDAYQVNLTMQLRAPLPLAEALAAYLAVRRSFEAPLGGYLRLADVALLSNSPELLLRRRGSSVESRPIKGTARRVEDPALDLAGATALRQSSKDAAEHVMIVDLVRHDLGRVAVTGSVRVEGMMRLLTLPTVHHLVSTVCAEVPAALDTATLLGAVLPGGSITGAPKRRAMQIIDELEGRERGVYCGAFGWIAPNGDCDLALPIRTAVVTRDELVLGVGGGIVVDSEPAAELAECRMKASAFTRALGGR